MNCEFQKFKWTDSPVMDRDGPPSKYWTTSAELNVKVARAHLLLR